MAIASFVSLLWLVAAGLFLWALGGDAALWLAMVVAVALPVAGAWFAALLALQSAELRREAARVAEAAETVRRASAAIVGSNERETQTPAAKPSPSAPKRMAPTPEPEPAPQLTSPPPAPRRNAPPRPAAQRSEPRQESLLPPVEVDAPQVTATDLTRALDFPESAEDEEGFRALRLALRDPRTRRLVQASQDVLTLLSEEGIYMDDLTPEQAQPEIWRRFAGGERGPSVAQVGGIRDRSSLALTTARMRNDPVFRDAAHHFLRLFDGKLAEIAPDLTDAEMAELAQTRTARAFMLIGRVAGIFH